MLATDRCATACRAGEIPVRADLDAHVPEAKDYALLYSLDLPDITYANDRVVYPIDRRHELAGAFDRVAGGLGEDEKIGEHGGSVKGAAPAHEAPTR